MISRVKPRMNSAGSKASAPRASTGAGAGGAEALRRPREEARLGEPGAEPPPRVEERFGPREERLVRRAQTGDKAHERGVRPLVRVEDLARLPVVGLLVLMNIVERQEELVEAA